MTNPSPARRRFGAHLKALRLEADRTQLAIGARVKASPDAVATWEKGRSLPGDATARALDAYLEADGALYRDYQTAVADKPTPRPTPPGTILSATTVLADSARAAADFGTWAETTNVGEVAITALHARLREIADRALTEPPATVAAEAARLSQDVFTLLRGHHRPAHARLLYATAGATCGLLTWLAGDVGEPDLAAVHGATAAQCADMSENPATTAWVAVVRSKTAFWARNYQAAADIAARAAHHGPPGTAAVMLACQQADAYAKLGDTERTRLALEQAARAADQIREPDHVGGLFSCGTGRAAQYAAACHHAIGAQDRALAEADAALAAFTLDPHVGFGTIAQTHITRTLAYAATRQWDAAADAVRPVLDLPREQHLATLVDRLAPLARALNRPEVRASSVAGPLREEITEFCTPAQRRALPGPASKEEHP